MLDVDVLDVDVLNVVFKNRPAGRNKTSKNSGEYIGSFTAMMDIVLKSIKLVECINGYFHDYFTVIKSMLIE